MHILVLQTVFLFSIFLATLFPYILPLVLTTYLKTSRTFNLILSVGNCISCGVFVGVCFLGLIPYAHERMTQLMKMQKIETTFPVTETLVVMGFLLTLLLEQLVLKMQGQQTIRKQNDVKVDLEANETLLTDAGSTLETQFQIQETSNEPHGHSHDEFNASSSSGFRFLLLTVASSTHSFFEGLAVGLQTDAVKALNIFIGMIIHESLVAFALGVSLAKLQRTFYENMRYVTFFCVAIPSGIIVGMCIGQTTGIVGQAVNAALQSLAAGTFIHITFMELIPSEFRRDEINLLKLLFLFIGFMIVTVLNLSLQ